MVERQPGVLSGQVALQQQRPAPGRLEQLDVAPDHAQVILPGDELGNGHRVCRSGLAASEILERDARAEAHIEQPGTVPGKIQDRGGRKARRHRETVTHVAFARTLYLRIHGQHQRGAIRSAGSGNETPGQLAVAQYIKLELFGRGCLARDLLDGAGRHRGQTVRHAVLLRGACAGQFAPA